MELADSMKDAARGGGTYVLEHTLYQTRQLDYYFANLIS